MRKKLLGLFLAMGLALGLIAAPTASASFKDFYLSNIGSVNTGITTYPYYHGYNRIVNAGTTYSNYNSATYPQTGDITSVWIGAGYSCAFYYYSHVTGALYKSYTIHNGAGPSKNHGITGLDRDLVKFRCYKGN